MNAYFEKCSKLILDSDLHPARAEKLLLALSQLENDAQLKSLYELFMADPAWIQKMSDNYQAKHAAMLLGDKQWLNDILAQQVKDLEALETETRA